MWTFVYVSLFATAAANITCSAVKEAYKSSPCCGAPDPSAVVFDTSSVCPSMSISETDCADLIPEFAAVTGDEVRVIWRFESSPMTANDVAAYAAVNAASQAFYQNMNILRSSNSSTLLPYFIAATATAANPMGDASVGSMMLANAVTLALSNPTDFVTGDVSSKWVATEGCNVVYEILSAKSKEFHVNYFLPLIMPLVNIPGIMATGLMPPPLVVRQVTFIANDISAVKAYYAANNYDATIQGIFNYGSGMLLAAGAIANMPTPPSTIYLQTA